MNEQSRQIYDYIQSLDMVSVIIGGAICGLGLFAAAALVQPLCLFIVAFGAVFCYLGFATRNKAKKELAELEKSGTLELAAQDFQNAARYLDDRIRIGQTYVFGAKTGAICKISEITKVFQYVHKTNMIEDRRELHAVVNSNTIILCRLTAKRAFVKNAPDADALPKVLMHLLMINPNIHIGYK